MTLFVAIAVKCAIAAKLRAVVRHNELAVRPQLRRRLVSNQKINFLDFQALIRQVFHF